MRCKMCEEEKIKDPVIRNNIVRYVNADNRLWNGKICPECYKAYNRERMRRTRAAAKLDVGNPRDV